MKIKTNKISFSKAASLVSDATLKRGDNAILKSILLIASKEEQKVTLRATDTMIEITTQFECEVIESGTCCFDTFVVEVVQNLGDELLLTLNGNVLNVTSGESNHNFNIIGAERFPVKQNIQNYVEFSNLPKFIEGINLCSTCVDINAAEDYAKTFKLDFAEGNIISTNRKKVSIYNIDSELTGTTIIPAKMLGYVMPKLSGSNDPIQFSIGDWCGFKNSEFEIAINTFKLNYPDVKTVVGREKAVTPKFKLTTKLFELQRILNLCLLYERQAEQNNQDSYTILRVDREKVNISVNIENFSRMNEPFTCELTDNQVSDYEIWFSATELNKLIMALSCESLTIHFFENNKAFFVYPLGLDNYTYLQMPFIKSVMAGK